MKKKKYKRGKCVEKEEWKKIKERKVGIDEEEKISGGRKCVEERKKERKKELKGSII